MLFVCSGQYSSLEQGQNCWNSRRPFELFNGVDIVVELLFKTNTLQVQPMGDCAVALKEILTAI